MTLLAARSISHDYGQPVLQDVSFDIASGETVALLGRSGCGKSTLSRLLCGLEQAKSGQIMVEGHPIARTPRAAVQMVFQDPLGALDPRLTVGQTLSQPLRRLRGIKDCEPHLHDLLHAVDLQTSDAAKYPAQFSGGQLQRICIARALAAEPKLIILDEAVSNLDLHLQAQMLDLFARLGRELGVGYLFVTHDLRLVERFCTRVLVMDAGRIVEDAAVTRPMRLTSAEGRALQDAVLPALPSMRMNATPTSQNPA